MIDGLDEIGSDRDPIDDVIETIACAVIIIIGLAIAWVASM